MLTARDILSAAEELFGREAALSLAGRLLTKAEQPSLAVIEATGHRLLNESLEELADGDAVEMRYLRDGQLYQGVVEHDSIRLLTPYPSSRGPRDRIVLRGGSHQWQLISKLDGLEIPEVVVERKYKGEEEWLRGRPWRRYVRRVETLLTLSLEPGDVLECKHTKAMLLVIEQLEGEVVVEDSVGLRRTRPLLVSSRPQLFLVGHSAVFAEELHARELVS